MGGTGWGARFGVHWREGRGEDRGRSDWRGEMDILITWWAYRVVYWISGAKLVSGCGSPLALGVVP